MIAKVRTAASDLLVASGVDQDEANRLIRDAFGEHEQRASGPAEQNAAPKPPTAPPLG